jgi:peroxiredoxin Q/BCP
MPKPGEKAPQFTLLSDEGKEVSLSDFRGKKVVVYFYPKANTPGCTKQACALRDAFPKIAEKGVVVIGISPDRSKALVKFREKHGLVLILLSDFDHEVAEAYGAWGGKSMMGKRYQGILRSHFAIDADGGLTEFTLNVKPHHTAELALKLVKN